MIPMFSFAHLFSQAVGDYGTNGNGIWNTSYFWLVCTQGGTWASANASATPPSASTNVWILNGDNVTVTNSTIATCKNLYIQNGAILTVGSSASIATINCNGNLYVYAGGLLSSASTTNIQNEIAMTGATNPIVQIDGTLGDNNANHLINLVPKVANSTLDILSSITNPGNAYINVVKPNAAGIKINFKRNVTLTNSSVGLCYSNSSNQGYDGTVVNINAGVTVNAIGSVAVNASAISVPAAGGGGNGSLNVNGTLTIGGGLSVKNDPAKSFALNIGSTGILTIGKHFNLPTGNGALSLTVNAGGSVSFSNASDSCSIPDAVCTINGIWDFTNTIANGRSIGTASVSGKLLFTDNIFPVGITLNTGSTVQYNGSNSYALSAFPSTYYNLTVNNASGVTLGTNTMVSTSLAINNGSLTTGTNNLSLGAAATAVFAPATSLIISGGTTNFNNRSVTLQSNNTGTASIGTISGVLSNATNVTVQRYLSAQRAYRLLGHPFNSNVALSSLQPYVDITGSGTGLTAGSASAFNYLTGAWSAYTGNTQTWNRNEAMLLFVRGTPGQGIGITNGGYAPSAPTVALTGTVNTGSFSYLVKAASSFSDGGALGWNAIGNPYPAPIDVNSIGGIAGVGGSGASIYVWNAAKGSMGAGTASGGYDFYTLGSSIVVPTYGAFFIKNTSGLDQFIGFTEGNKNTGTAPLSLLRNGTAKQGFDLVVADSAVYWDRLRVNLDSTAVAGSTDRTDLDKFGNTNLDFYSIGSDKVKLAVNTLPVLQSASDMIPLGLTTNQQRVFTVKAENVNLASLNGTLFLQDRYAKQLVKLEAGMSYSFEVTADTATKGENRFAIIFTNKTTATPIGGFTAKVLGNAITNNQAVRVQVQNATTNAMIQVWDLGGKTVATEHAVNGINMVSIGNAASGMYIVQITDGSYTVTEKVVKQ